MHTQISSLPEELARLKNLKHLDLSYTSITELPSFLGRVPLEHIGLAGLDLPPEVRAASDDGTAELLRYLKLIDEDGTRISEVKLILVGEGGVGKSSLLAALRGEPWVEDREQTHGLEVKELLVNDGEGDIVLNAWDFGGQQEYRPTHQLFFTAPAIYVLVWKPRAGAENGMVTEWLSMIRHRAGETSRVLIVATHGGPSSRAFALDEAALRARFGSMIVSFHSVDSIRAETLTELSGAMAQTAAGIPHVRRWYPNSWLRARDFLQSCGEESMTEEEYLRVTSGSLDLGRRDAISLAMNSHALGHWVYYAEEPELSEIIILKPDWLSTAIAAVLEDPVAADHGGLVSHRRFGEIWDLPGFNRPAYSARVQRVFLRLMERFELSYRVPELSSAEPVSLVGQLVPAERPNLSLSWEGFRPEGPEATVICQAVESGTSRVVDPEGLIYRLIVRLHRQALDPTAVAGGGHWRGGLLVESRYGARGLITLTAEGIRLQVRGPEPMPFLQQLLESVRLCIEGFWEGLETRAMIPCGPACGLGTPGEGLFNRDKLVKALERTKTIQCPEPRCDEWPDIEQLLQRGPASHYEAPSLAEEVVGELMPRLDSIIAEHSERLIRCLDGLPEEVQGMLSDVESRLQTFMICLASEAADGPRLFSLRPLDASFAHPGWTHQLMRLTLYCEHSRWPVSALDPSSGTYDLQIPREWFLRAAPLLKTVAALLKPALGVALAAEELRLEDAEWRKVSERLKLEKESLSAAADAASIVAGTASGIRAGRTGGGDSRPIEASGGVLRELHSILKAKDPSFSDLRRVSDHGEWKWVYRDFVRIYQPGLPEIPRG